MVQYVVDPTRSSISITPQTLLIGSPLGSTPQGPGAWTASYSGVVEADLTGASIQLLPGTNLVAGNSGDWRPSDDYSSYNPNDANEDDGYVNTPAPANYGTFTDLTALGGAHSDRSESPSALREIQIRLTDNVAKPITGGEFDEAGMGVSFTSGLVYYGAGGSPPVTDLVNTVSPDPTTDAPGTATLNVDGNIETLTLPVQFEVTYFINFLVSSTQYEGTIVATRVVPEPTTVALLAPMGIPLLLRRGRHRGRSRGSNSLSQA
jgi:hypothetical protein